MWNSRYKVLTQEAERALSLCNGDEYQEILQVGGGEEALEVLDDRESVALLGGVREAQEEQLTRGVLELRALQLSSQDAPLECSMDKGEYLHALADKCRVICNL